jgi:hypothetical protein
VWVIPVQLSQQFISLSNLVQHVIIPKEPHQDLLLWKHTDTGDLNLADAYHFKLQQDQVYFGLNFYGVLISLHPNLFLFGGL